jgi:hypothetical protein
VINTFLNLTETTKFITSPLLLNQIVFCLHSTSQYQPNEILN